MAKTITHNMFLCVVDQCMLFLLIIFEEIDFFNICSCPNLLSICIVLIIFRLLWTKYRYHLNGFIL